MPIGAYGKKNGVFTRAEFNCFKGGAFKTENDVTGLYKFKNGQFLQLPQSDKLLVSIEPCIMQVGGLERLGAFSRNYPLNASANPDFLPLISETADQNKAGFDATTKNLAIPAGAIKDFINFTPPTGDFTFSLRMKLNSAKPTPWTGWCCPLILCYARNSVLNDYGNIYIANPFNSTNTDRVSMEIRDLSVTPPHHALRIQSDLLETWHSFVFVARRVNDTYEVDYYFDGQKRGGTQTIEARGTYSYLKFLGNGCSTLFKTIRVYNTALTQIEVQKMIAWDENL